MSLDHIIFALAFSILYIAAYFNLNPFRFHRKLKYSTLFLKGSYLLYLIVAFYTIYMNSFYSNATLSNNVSAHSMFIKLIIFIMYIGLVIPTITIFIRRKIKDREPYNLLMGAINIGFIIFYVLYNIFSVWKDKVPD